MKVYKIKYSNFLGCSKEEFIYASLEKAKDKACEKINEIIAEVINSNEDRIEEGGFAYYFQEVSENGLDTPVKECPNFFKSIKKVSQYIREVMYSTKFGENQRWDYAVEYNMFRYGETYTDYNYSITIEEFELII